MPEFPFLSDPVLNKMPRVRIPSPIGLADHRRQPALSASNEPARVVFTVVSKREKSLRVAEEPPSSTNARPQKLLDRVRWHLRVKRYSIRTEQAYIDWIRRFTP